LFVFVFCCGYCRCSDEKKESEKKEEEDETELGSGQNAGQIPIESLLFGHLIDSARRFKERLFDILGGLGRRLEESEVVLLGEILALLAAHLSLRFEVALVADQHHRDVLVRILPAVVQPRRQVFESLTPSDVVDEQTARSAAVIRASDRTKLFLASRVPDLELDLGVVDGDRSRAELDSDREVVDRLETLVCELQKQTGFPDGCVSDDDVLEQVLVWQSLNDGRGTSWS